MTKEVKRILSSVFANAQPTSIKRFSKGIMNQTYDVILKGKHFVVRYIPKEKWKIQKEHYLYDLIAKKTNVPVPQVYFAGKDFLILEKVKGRELSLSDSTMVRKAGRLLASLHSIKFKRYGWIVGKDIDPAFLHWHEFIDYDTRLKLRKFGTEAKDLKKPIRTILSENEELFKLSSRPSLLHKDYHSSHIITANGKISGLIDLEWAMAGHHEMDIAKSTLWMFTRKPAMEKLFLSGYRSVGSISKRFSERKDLYRMLVLISSLSLSYECKNNKWCQYNLKELRRAVQRLSH